MLDQTQNGGMPGQTRLLEHLKVKAGQNLTLPTGDSAGRFTTGYECLRVDHESTAKERRPDKRRVLVCQRSFDCPCHQRRRLQLTKGVFSLFNRVDDLDAISAGSSIRL